LAHEFEPHTLRSLKGIVQYQTLNGKIQKGILCENNFYPLHPDSEPLVQGRIGDEVEFRLTGRDWGTKRILKAKVYEHDHSYKSKPRARNVVNFRRTKTNTMKTYQYDGGGNGDTKPEVDTPPTPSPTTPDIKL
jgi:hypothetical protein